MQIKDSTVRFKLEPIMLDTLGKVDRIYRHFGHECVITSCNDGHHSKNSYHYKNLGYDIRTFYFDDNTKIDVYNELKRILGENYDVVNESNHFHIEVSPKGFEVFTNEKK